MKNDFLDYSDSLSHYGVLGMKWGVRKHANAHTFAGPIKMKNGKKESIAYATVKSKNGKTSIHGESYAQGGYKSARKAINAAEYDLIKNSKKYNNPDYTDTKGYKNMEKRVTKNTLKEYNKAKKNKEYFDNVYKTAVTKYGQNHEGTQKMLTMSILANDEYVKAGKKLAAIK